MRLVKSGAISTEVMRLTRKVLDLCDEGVHRRAITAEQADEVIDIATVLARHYRMWLIWGFDGKHEAPIPSRQGPARRG